VLINKLTSLLSLPWNRKWLILETRFMLTDRHVSGVVLVKTCMLEIDVHAILPEDSNSR
jgi:hypothetical protein